MLSAEEVVPDGQVNACMVSRASMLEHVVLEIKK